MAQSTLPYAIALYPIKYSDQDRCHVVHNPTTRKWYFLKTFKENDIYKGAFGDEISSMIWEKPLKSTGYFLEIEPGNNKGVIITTPLPR